jgi:hypothetical protein
METKYLLPCSEQVATGPYSEPNEFGPQPHTISFKIHFNIILPYTGGLRLLFCIT